MSQRCGCRGEKVMFGVCLNSPLVEEQFQEPDVYILPIPYEKLERGSPGVVTDAKRPWHVIYLPRKRRIQLLRCARRLVIG